MNQERCDDKDYSRHATRDRLVEFDPIINGKKDIKRIYPWLDQDIVNQDYIILPPVPTTIGFKIIYPWETTGLSMMCDQIYILASRYGYEGEREEFHRLVSSYLQSKGLDIIIEDFNNFPEFGQLDNLYYDISQNTLYYWDGEQYTLLDADLITNDILEFNNEIKY